MSVPAVTILPPAEDDISDAFRWYEDKASGLGSEFMRALDACLSGIQRYPKSGSPVHKEVRRALLRRFPYGVFYLLEGETIIVIACFHASRDPKEWQKRTE